MNDEHLAEVEAIRRADVVLDHVTAARQQWAREHRRPRALTAREALLALQFEASVVWVVAAGLRAGFTPTSDDFERLAIAVQRIDVIAEEAIG